MLQTIQACLPGDYPWRDRILWFPSTDSTNRQLKALGCQGAPQGTAVIAGSQTQGQGRMGRSFHSPEGKGVYLSLLLRPDCAPSELMHLTCAVAVAMCDAVEAVTGLRPGIKWTNDLVWGSKKLGGILTESRLTRQGCVDFVIIGIGINCLHSREDFPPELKDMAASLAMVTGQDISPARLAAAMLEALHRMAGRLLTEKPRILEAYRKDCITLGREVSVVRGEEIRRGTAVAVDDQGALVVAWPEGGQEAVNSGEVSIRGMYGYIN